MALVIFSIDAEALKDLVEDLVEALDVCGYGAPLRSWERDDSKLRLWVASVEDEEAEPVEVFEEWKQQLAALTVAVSKTTVNEVGQRINQPRAQEAIRMAAQEFLECCTFEER